MRVLLSLVLLVFASGVQPALALADDPRIDPTTGRQIAAWAPDRPFDHEHMRLELRFPDMNKAEFEGVMALRAKAVGEARGTLTLDSKGPKVSRVLVRGIEAAYTLQDNRLSIALVPPAQPGEVIDAVVEYACDFSGNKGDGLVWRKPREDAKSESGRMPQVWSQGQPEHNSRWFPCHDSPNEKLTMELIVTAPEAYEVCSNGRLISTNAAQGGMKTWHWSQETPHPAYLVTLAIGRFSVIDLADEKTRASGLRVVAYVPVGSEESAATTLGATAEMIRFFETLFDEPYPWAQYAQVCARGFNGGMENTSATTMMDAIVNGRAGQWDGLIAHELAHQWFGDLVTCNSWDHLWLNEGWATYAEALWDEHKASPQGPEKAKEAYQRNIAGNLRSQRVTNRGFSPDFPAMVSNRYTDPDEMFSRLDNPYPKGACVLHMLRMRIGDTAFFKGSALYLDRYKHATATTDDFRRCLEETSGVSLEQFFDQRVYRPGYPRLGVDLSWDESTRTLGVAFEQTQKIDRFNPAYTLDIPVLVRFSDGSSRTFVSPMNARTGRLDVVLDSRPTRVSIDPDLTICAPTQIRTPLTTAEPAASPAAPAQ
jgi:aminopeptidase N